jgi:protein-L-isoaspartate(D-aspartate) O-methyltransferase
MQASPPHKAREAMVVSQLAPAGITSERVLNAYRDTPREDFVPPHLKGVCYTDETLDLGNGVFLLAPMIHGLLVDELNVDARDAVLDLGDATGYSSAVLQKLAARVDTEFAAEGPAYDVILLNGAVSFVPEELTARLTPNGRLACVFQPEPRKVGKILVVTRDANDVLIRRFFEDATAPYVNGLAPQPEFVF